MDLLAPRSDIYTPANPVPDPGVAAAKALQQKFLEYGPGVNAAVRGFVDRHLEGMKPEAVAAPEPGKTFTYTLKRGDKTATVESPRELTDDELTTLSVQEFGAPSQQPTRRYLGGGLYQDERGATKQLEPGEFERLFPEEAKATRRSGGILAGTEKPQTMEETALQAVGAVPMMVGPWWAQMATT